MEPLANRNRPINLDEFIGQDHLVSKDGPLRKFIETGQIPSMIFWGPPGTGKTTLAFIISQMLQFDFHKLQAVNSGKEKLRKILRTAIDNQLYNKRTILFLDEIHRWNKAQQDALLPYVEKGIVTLIGATTENPSFTINNALLSRAKVFVFKAHTLSDIKTFLEKVAVKEYPKLKFEKGTTEAIAEMANGDMRSALNMLEICNTLAASVNSPTSKAGPLKVTKKLLVEATQHQLYHDRNGEDHYNIISAVHKSLRSSNPDAACYWVTRLLQAGDDPLYVARRLLRFASEDIGNADPQAVILANTVFETCQKLGMPECNVHLIQLAIYLAKAPKDNSAYVVAELAKEDVEKFGNLPVPLHIRNGVTKLMQEIGYGKGYEYDHDLPGKKSKQECMPEKLKGKKYLK